MAGFSSSRECVAVCETVTIRVLVSAPFTFLVRVGYPRLTQRKDPPMPIITTKDGVEIFYKDWGGGQPIVFSHGWPLSADDWDGQMLFFLGKGYRVIAHDRRGHGRSSQTGDGHDMDHYADDLAAVTEKLDLRN